MKRKKLRNKTAKVLRSLGVPFVVAQKLARIAVREGCENPENATGYLLYQEKVCSDLLSEIGFQLKLEEFTSGGESFLTCVGIEKV
jgi:hypothetical protein